MLIWVIMALSLKMFHCNNILEFGTLCVEHPVYIKNNSRFKCLTWCQMGSLQIQLVFSSYIAVRSTTPGIEFPIKSHTKKLSLEGFSQSLL